MGMNPWTLVRQTSATGILGWVLVSTHYLLVSDIWLWLRALIGAGAFAICATLWILRRNARIYEHVYHQAAQQIQETIDNQRPESPWN